jgi:hypothetical protein
VPGAAGLEAAIDFGSAIDSAFVQSKARLAIANAKDGGIVLLRWDGSPRLTTLSSSLTKITTAGFSRSGDNALISDGQGGVENWSGLLGDPVQKAVYGPDILGGIATALAINDNGLALAGTDSGNLLRLGDSTATLSSGSWSALTFLPNQTDALAADNASGRLVLLRDVANGGDPVLVADGLQQPSAIAVSADGSSAAVAMQGARSISFFDLTNNSSTSVDCHCIGARFEQLNGNLVFRIVDSQGGMIQMIDGDGLLPRIVPVPEFSATAALARTN